MKQNNEMRTVEQIKESNLQWLLKHVEGLTEEIARLSQQNEQQKESIATLTQENRRIKGMLYDARKRNMHLKKKGLKTCQAQSSKDY